VVVGRSFLTPSASSERAFRWTAPTGMQDLGNLPGQGRTVATALSADGASVVGYSGSHPFRWTLAGGMQDLGTLPGGTQAFAFGVSADGQVVCGYGTDAQGRSVAFRWTAGAGFTTLGVLPTGSGSFANAISGGGAVVVGRADSAGFPRAFLWSSPTGLVDLNTYLAGLGLNLSGWVLTRANAVSADGRTIVGDGTHNGASEGWIAVLPGSCYANCDQSTTAPMLNVADFTCFLQRFAAADPYANCDQSTLPPVLNVADFTCFLQGFAAGCP
jgi:probable HAF family extracellular repeat protein